MKRSIFLITAFLLSCFAHAQDAGVMNPYPDSPGVETPVPAGYKPFYISHFGRHGSRYLSSEKNVLPALKALRQGKEQNLLTSDGEMLLSMAEELYSASDGMWGQLSALGVEEHKYIARRMVKRCPAVFMDSVHVQASIYPRCILSMAASTGEIARLAPKTKWSYVTGNRYQSIVNTRHRPSGWVSGASAQQRYLEEHLDTERIIARLFTDPQRGSGIVGGHYSFFKALYNLWSGREAIGLEPFDLSALVGDDAVRILNASENLAHYRNMAIPNTDSLITDIVLRADAALARQKPSADLRYAHDNGLMRLLVQIGMEGYPVNLDDDRAAAFCFAEKVPLAANLQIVFYRNLKGKVLVKFLVNEKECRLTALPGGPYYAWEDVRAVLDKYCLK